MRSSPNRSVLTESPDPSLALRREILVTGLFKYMTEIQEIEGGYAFKFSRSELLVRRITDYFLFEGQHSPQLIFALHAEPNTNAIWLQIRGLEREKEQIRTVYTSHRMRVSPPA